MTNQQTIIIADLMDQSGVKFGTSGARGLVSDMTDKVCWLYVAGFLQYLDLPKGSSVGIAGDLRASTDRIMNASYDAARHMGYTPVNLGKIPSPAAALFGMAHNMPTIMVTGSHIPDDRNGIKFNTADGEILKNAEQGIKEQVVLFPHDQFDEHGMINKPVDTPSLNTSGYTEYVERYLSFFPKDCLRKSTIGLYEHSCVTRDCFKEILEGLGANVTSLGRSDKFIPVDTEAIRPEDVTLAKQWITEFNLDCIISTDGDGDRPLISDERGTWLRGDVAGIFCAKYLNADIAVTPVSSNSAVEKSGFFKNVLRTKIGSPYVVAAMEDSADQGTVIGYEANGGFLLGTDIEKDNKTMARLPTRDAVIVPLAILMLAKEQDCNISALANMLPSRFTASDRLKDFATEKSRKIIESFSKSDPNNPIHSLFPLTGSTLKETNSTDGMRLSFENEEVIHLRPSGNAPELRCYNEASSVNRAEELNKACITAMNEWRD